MTTPPASPRECRVGDLRIGQGRPLAIIAGPCVLESLALALLGIAVAITGWIKTHPREFPAGCCQKCGYELKDLPRCPECGTERSATTKEDGHSAGDGPATPSPQTPPDSLASSHDTTR